MNVSLPPELERLVAKKVASGGYQSASDVICDALQLLQDRDQRRLEDLRREIAIGLDQADRGEIAPMDMDAIRSEARRRLAQPPPQG